MILETIVYNETEQIKCMYYEIEENCIEIITKYCSESKENNESFQKFASSYHTFKLFFDFVN